MSELYAAIKAKDTKAVKAALAGGADPNVFQMSSPLLVHAVNKRSKGIVKALLAAGADASVKGKKGMDALRAAAEELPDPKIGALLVEAGADLDGQDNDEYEGLAPLHLAVRRKKLDFAEFLVESGANLEIRERGNDDTPLTLLLRTETGSQSNTEKANALWLIEKGADVHAVASSGMTTLHLAAQNCSLEMVELLVERGVKPVANDYGSTPLHMCVGYHDKDRALWDRLMALGCGLEDVGHGMTVLHTAINQGNHVAAAYFIDKGANLQATDDEGRTALELLQNSSNKKLAKLATMKG